MTTLLAVKSVRSSKRPVQYARHGHVGRAKKQQPQQARSSGLEDREVRTRPRGHWCVHTVHGAGPIYPPLVGASLIVQTMVITDPCRVTAKASQVYARIHIPTPAFAIDAHSFGFFIPVQGPVWPVQQSF